MRFGPDISNYQSQFSLADAQLLKAMQCSFIMIGRQWSNKAAAQQAMYAKAAGIEFLLEYWINLGWTQAADGTWSIAYPQPFDDTKYISIDVEPGSEFVTVERIREAVAKVKELGRTPRIYSAKGTWDQCGLAGVTEFADAGIELHDAHYDGVTDGYNLPEPFGGWTICVMDQYTDRWQDGGFPYPIDMNNCPDEAFGPAAPAAPVQTPIDVAGAVVHLDEAKRLLGG